MNKETPPCLCAVGIVIFHNQCLFLERKKPPLLWCPPCGKMEGKESPLACVKREVKEETALEVDPLLCIHVWRGVVLGNDVLSFSYVCRASSSKVTLSEEHSAYQWIDISKLSSYSLPTDFDLSLWPLWIESALFFQKNRDRLEKKSHS